MSSILEFSAWLLNFSMLKWPQVSRVSNLNLRYFKCVVVNSFTFDSLHIFSVLTRFNSLYWVLDNTAYIFIISTVTLLSVVLYNQQITHIYTYSIYAVHTYVPHFMKLWIYIHIHSYSFYSYIHKLLAMLFMKD